MGRIVVGVSGASGIILGIKSLVALAKSDYEIDLVISQAAIYTATLELGKEWSSQSKFLLNLPEGVQRKITHHSIHDNGANICSGSHLTDGMVIIPCSMATLAAVAFGLADNCLRRAADVTLKERRPLIIVPRETPLSEIHLENMLKLTRAGAIILPPIPAWYNTPKNLDEVEDFIVGKVLDLLKIEHNLYARWKR